ncbi:helix-turn-helix domain-containing protein [Sessilibacter corallicola]|uniref:Helix-turn-helix domain-containing protein n=1 Tax=Sessilibacter corallicola TaxID=2904075 RepID=A0ABQ0AD94_9GAMM
MSSLGDRWLSISEICEHLGVSSDTVYKWIDKQAMPAHRMGRLWKFKKEDVDNWIKAGGAGENTTNKGPSEILPTNYATK